MKPDEVVWQTREYSGFATARFDTLSPDGTHRLGKTVNIAVWPDRPGYRFAGTDKVMSNLSFVLWLQDKCQVIYNEYGEF